MDWAGATDFTGGVDIDAGVDFRAGRGGDDCVDFNPAAALDAGAGRETGRGRSPAGRLSGCPSLDFAAVSGLAGFFRRDRLMVVWSHASFARVGSCGHKLHYP